MFQLQAWQLPPQLCQQRWLPGVFLHGSHSAVLQLVLVQRFRKACRYAFTIFTELVIIWTPLRSDFSLILRSPPRLPQETPKASLLWTGNAPTASPTALRWSCPQTERSFHSLTSTITARSLTSGSCHPATREIRYSLVVLVFTHCTLPVCSQKSVIFLALLLLLSWFSVLRVAFLFSFSLDDLVDSWKQSILDFL